MSDTPSITIAIAAAAAVPDPATAPRWRDRVLIVVFAVFLLLPTLDLAFHLDPTPAPDENRPLAPWPAPPKNFAGLKTYLAGWQAYYNDHFGWRRSLITWQNKLKWSWFNAQSTRGAMLGTDGWLYISGNHMVDHFRGALQFTEPELQAWQKLLEHRRDWLAQRGIKYLFVLAPDKQTIYPEHLPPWLRPLGGRTKTDQFFAYMRAHSTVPVLDLRPALFAAKKIAPAYQTTDTHWNNYGAFMAGEAVVQRLADEGVPGLQTLTIDSFATTNHPVHGGDLARIMGVNVMEINAVTLIPKPGLPPLELTLPPHPRMRVLATAKNPRATGSVLVFTDSYGQFWPAFLGYHFGEADFLWAYPLDVPMIEKQKPDIVVSEMLERFFDVADPHELSTGDALP